MAIVYAVANQKGGVGKTTTCVCLGGALAEKGRKVLLIDLDPQAGLTTSLGFEPISFSTTIYDVLLAKAGMQDVVTHTKFKGLDFVPANLELVGVEAELLGEKAWDRALRESLKDLKDIYEFVLIDCPPSLGVLTVNALMAADRVIIPVQTEYLALKGLGLLYRVISRVKKTGNPKLDFKVLRTMHQSRTIHSREASEEIEGVLKGKVYKAIIPRSIKFAEASFLGEPIISYLPKSKMAQAYRELAEEVLADA